MDSFKKLMGKTSHIKKKSKAKKSGKALNKLLGY